MRTGEGLLAPARTASAVFSMLPGRLRTVPSWCHVETAALLDGAGGDGDIEPDLGQLMAMAADPRLAPVTSAAPCDHRSQLPASLVAKQSVRARRAVLL